MLEKDFNTVQDQTVETANVPAQTTNHVVAQFAAQTSPFTLLLDAFSNAGIDLPAEATKPCTIVNGSIRFGNDMQFDFGDYAIIRPLNLTKYKKVNLGVSNPSDDEKRLQLNSRDGQTVTTEDGQTFTLPDYLDKLQSMGYSKAKIEDRAVLHGQYVDSDRHSKIGEHVAPDDIFAIYLSPSSLRSWGAFLAKASLTGASGYLKLGKEMRTWNGISWTQFSFVATAPVERKV